jgi:hypothetical protein
LITLSIIFINFAAAAIPSDYASYYRFDSRANGETAENNGILIGNPVFSSGIPGSGLQFDRIDDHVDTLHYSPFNFGRNGFSIRLWEKINNDARIYDRSLTAEEIKSIYDTSLPTSGSGHPN